MTYDDKKQIYVIGINLYTGITLLIEELNSHNVGLIAINTDDCKKYKIFQSALDYLPEIIVDCTEAEIPDKVLELKSKYPIAFVFTGLEFMQNSADVTNMRLGIDDFNDPGTSQIRFQKYQMLESLRSHGLTIPKQLLIDIETCDLRLIMESVKNLTFPIIVKPDTGAGTTCTAVCDHIDNLALTLDTLRIERSTCDQQPISKEYILQEFINGTEYLVDSYSVNGNHIITGVFSYSKFLLDNVPIYQSINYDGITKKELVIIEYVRQVLDILGQDKGMVNTDLMLIGETPVLLEINCRIVGLRGQISRMEKHISGFNQATLLALDVLGSLANIPPPQMLNNIYARLVILQNYEERMMNKTNDKIIIDLPSYVEHSWFFKEGSMIPRARNLAHGPIGAVLLMSNSKNSLEEDYKTLIKFQNDSLLF